MSGNNATTMGVSSTVAGRGFRKGLDLTRAGGTFRGAVLSIGLLVFLGCPGFAQGATPSLTRGPYLQNVTENSIVICWETDVPTDGTVEYWVEGSQDSSIVRVSSDLRHEVRLEELQSGTAYCYRVRIPAEGDGTFFTAGFKTAPVEDVPFTFAVYGDSRSNVAGHRSVVEGVRAANPDFVLHTGDMVSHGDSPDRWEDFWAVAAPPTAEESLGAYSPIYPAVGNHEYMMSTGVGYKDEAIVTYQQYFVLPANGLESEYPEWSERFYSFHYGPAFFIVLDTNNDSDPDYDVLATFTDSGTPDIHPGSPQYEWMIDQLEFASGRFPFTFVAFHGSPYSTGYYGKSSSIKLRFLDPVFRQYGVDAVFTSHDHFYERCETYVEGYRILYLVEGAGGASLYSRTSGWDEPGSWMWDELNGTIYSKAFDNSSFSFIRVDAVPLGNGNWRATFSATRPDGEVFDVAQIERPWSHLAFGGGLKYSFETRPGETYQVEYSDDLPEAEMEWRLFGEPIPAESPVIHIIDDGTVTGTHPANNSVRHRFYRVGVLL